MKILLPVWLTSSLAATLPSCSQGAIPEPKFRLNPGQTALVVTPGGEVSSFILLNLQANLSDTVRMRLDDADLPAGLREQSSRDSVNGDCSFRLIAGEDTPPGTYTIDLTGSPVQDAPFTGTPVESAGLNGTNLRPSDGPTFQGSITVTVLPKLANRSVSAQPAIDSTARVISSIGLAEVAVRVSAQGGFSGTVDLSVTGTNGSSLPQGVTASFTRGSVIAGSIFGHSLLRLLVAGIGQPGTYLIDVVAKGGLKTKTIPVQLEVTNAALPRFTRLIPESLSRTRPTNFTVPANPSGQLSTEQNGGSGATITFDDVPVGVSVVKVNSPFFAQPDKLGWRFFKLGVGSRAPVGNFPITVKMIFGGIVQARILSLEIRAQKTTGCDEVPAHG